MRQPPSTVLFPYPRLQGVSGGHGVTAWAMQALLEAGHRVILATMYPPELDLLDRAFGTRLREHPLEVVLAPSSTRVFMRALPFPGGSLEAGLMERWTRRLSQEYPIHLIFSTNNEMHLPGRGLQYVHFPRFYRKRPAGDLRPVHRIPGILPVYRLCQHLLRGPGLMTWKDNLTLANSRFIAGLARAAGAREVEILTPPVVLRANPLPWDRRDNRIVMAGRIHRSKRVEMMIDILESLRAGGDPFEAVLVGSWDSDAAYRDVLSRRIEATPWLRHLQGLSREELSALFCSSRYGLHAMEAEHFGMSVAEMLRAGMVVFVHDSGGPAEILAHAPSQRFRTAEEAARLMAAVMKDSKTAVALHLAALEQGAGFSEKAFCAGIREAVKRFPVQNLEEKERFHG